ncbi:MAG: CaiA [Firmicutes bacterium]|nr:CaiA [Bacillota bacterium]
MKDNDIIMKRGIFMDLALTEEQLLIQQTVKEFIQDQAELSVKEVFSGLAQLDFMGIFVPEKYSGADCDFMSYTLALEELSKVSASIALGYAIHSTQAVYTLLNWGSDSLKTKYLVELSKGQKIGAYAYEEAGVGEDLLSIDTTAVKQADNYCLSGEKTFVINGEVSDLYIVFAKMDEKLSAFLVEKDTPGISFTQPYTKMGLDGLPVVTMRLDNVCVPAENLLGREGDGESIAHVVRNVHSISLAAIAAGISQNAVEKCIDYGKQRIQFRRPIISFEALREMIGKMVVGVEAAHLLIYKAAMQKDQNGIFEDTSAIARYFAITTGECNCRDAIQFYGGYGYTKDLGVEVLLRDMKGLAVLETLPKPLILDIADLKIDQ